jgi:hypothetical protein
MRRPRGVEPALGERSEVIHSSSVTVVTWASDPGGETQAPEQRRAEGLRLAPPGLAVLKIGVGPDSMRAASRDAGPVTSIFSTSCPPARSASAIASTVSALSNSASSSLSVSRRLCENAMRSGRCLSP